MLIKENHFLSNRKDKHHVEDNGSKFFISTFYIYETDAVAMNSPGTSTLFSLLASSAFTDCFSSALFFLLSSSSTFTLTGDGLLLALLLSYSLTNAVFFCLVGFFFSLVVVPLASVFFLLVLGEEFVFGEAASVILFSLFLDGESGSGLVSFSSLFGDSKSCFSLGDVSDSLLELSMR